MNNRIQRKVRWATKRISRVEGISSALPWRKHKTPYKIFVAEILLIRTRADIVARVFPEFISKYPSIHELAKGTETELVGIIGPLGLKKRATYIIQAAKYIQNTYAGKIPHAIDALIKIPGLGLYSATAIATFAFDQKLVPADVNIFRFLSRFTGIDIGHKTKGSKELQELLPHLAEQTSGLNAESILDFCRLICRSRNPKCTECPLANKCDYPNSFKNGG
jgi:A/G-specific adenine glycosylase